MASFRFGSGNAAKLVRLPLYALGRLATLLVPRGDRWVFGCAVGVADGALALCDLAREEGHTVLWLAASEQEQREAHARGIPVARKYSLRGWWATARAGVLVVTHGLGDVNRYALGGGFLVQLWHGIPLKRIGLDSPATTQVPAVPGARYLRRLVSLLYRASTAQIRVLPAASERARGRLESAFALGHDRVVVTGEPRVDVLSLGTAQERKDRAVELVAAAAGEHDATSRAILYAPTWRDGDPDPAVPTSAQWHAIIALLEAQNAVLYVRSHHLGAGNYTPPDATTRVRLLGSDLVSDITPALCAMDALITDYSSMAVDAGLIDLPVLYLAPDEEHYAATRGFYGRYRDIAGDDVAHDWDTLLAQLGAVLTDDGERRRRVERGQAISSYLHEFRDGRNTYRVYQAIRARGIPAPKGAR